MDLKKKQTTKPDAFRMLKLGMQILLGIGP